MAFGCRTEIMFCYSSAVRLGGSEKGTLFGARRMRCRTVGRRAPVLGSAWIAASVILGKGGGDFVFGECLLCSGRFVVSSGCCCFA